MRVLELAKELKVETEALLHLLREMGIAVKGVSSQVSEAATAKVIARMERGRRSGAKDASEAMQVAVDDATESRDVCGTFGCQFESGNSRGVVAGF